MAIEEFKDQYDFLSSMYVVRSGIIARDKIIVPTVEHAYQAAKFREFDARQRIYKAIDGYNAKKNANRLEETGYPIIENWADIRLGVMRGLVEQKFTRDSQLQDLLLHTGEEEIVEGNTRGDTFWGVDPPGSSNGENWLGQILMEVRGNLQTKK